MEFTWARGSSDTLCLPCGRTRVSEHVFEWSSSSGTPMLGTRCPVCSSLTVHGGEQQYEPSDDAIDGYLQSEGGIDAILANLYRVDAPQGARFLDVGANYGFAVRYARDVLGWQAVGVEPSYSGRRGARELGVEILDQYITAETMLDDRFDVILASEVIEHVPDPAAFVTALRAHLAPGGTLVLTTPAAEVVAPATRVQGIQAVGPGGHLFLFTAEALEQFLRRHGFEAVQVVRDGQSLYATAMVESGRPLRATASGPTQQQMADFLATLVDDPASPPVLRTAMAVRQYRALVNLGRDAPDVERTMIEGVREVYAVDLSDPAAVASSLESAAEVPLLLAPAAFACGMRRIVHRQEWAEAVAYFDLAVAAVGEKRRRAASFDGDSRIIVAQSLAHRLLALLHTDAPRALDEWRRLRASDDLVDSAMWTVQLFVEAAALELTSLFDDELASVADAIVELGADGGEGLAVSAVNGAYLLGRAAVAHGDRWCGTQWASVAEQVLHARREVLSEEWRASATQLLAGLRGELSELRPEAIPSVVPMPGPEHESILWASADETTVAGGVSVVMALYRGERYVRDALESIAAQTRPPLEVIVVDDGSPDDSVRLVESLTLPFELRVVRQGNAGQSAARNTGIRAARGEFIAFLDQDDIWRPQHLELLEQAIQVDPTRAWVFSDFDLIDGEGRTIVSSYLTETSVVLDRRTVADIVRTDIMALPSASLMRRSALLHVRGFDRRLSGYEDDELYLRLYRAGWSVRAQQGTRIRYRTHPANASSSVAFLRSRLVFMQLLIEQYPSANGHAAAAEVAAERLLRSTTADYFAALVAGDDWLARTVSWALRRMLPVARGVSSYYRAGLRVMRRPRLARGTLRAAAMLPDPLRRRVLPPMVYWASELLAPHRSRAVSLDLARRPRWMSGRS